MNVAVPKEDAETTATDSEVTDTLHVLKRRLGSLCQLFAGGSGGSNVAKTDISKKCK